MSIAILDFGSQYTNLIRALLSDLGVSNEILPNSTPLDELKHYDGIIVSGGPSSVMAKDAPRFDRGLFELDIPILGICYGHQLMAYAMGGKVKSGVSQEYGRSKLSVTNPIGIFSELNSIEPVWMSHGDTVVEVPKGFTVAASTDSCPAAAMYNEAKKYYGVQFHPEVSQTSSGELILKNFVLQVCKCEAHPNIAGLIKRIEAQIENDVSTKNVFLLLSGGVDSNVAFVLLANTLGKGRVLGLHIDTGMLRNDETYNLLSVLRELDLNDRVRTVDASERFFEALKGLKDAEEKRKKIADTFLQVKDKAMTQLNLDNAKWMLGQGTIYTDLITSGLTTNAKTIKTHHNSLLDKRGTLPIVEPLKNLYKHQVRSVGVELGLPKSLVGKEPYPGPGNGVRILGEVNRFRADLQRKVDAIVTYELMKGDYQQTLFQGFPVIAFIRDFDIPKINGDILGTVTKERLHTVDNAEKMIREFLEHEGIEEWNWNILLLPLKTVGIKGDNRSYCAPLLVRVSPKGSWKQMDYEVLERMSSRITNGLDSVTRVVYDITRDEFARTKWEKLAFLRLITSREAMTVDWAKVDFQTLTKISARIRKETAIDRVMLDVTQKPPGMVEWE